MQYSASFENAYVAFFKDAVADNTDAVIGGFIDYAIDLMKSAVSLGVVSIEQLPASENIGAKITEVFNKKVNEIITAEVDTYVTSYVNWITSDVAGQPCPITDPAVLSVIEDQVQNYVSVAVQNYIANDFTVPSGASLIDSVVGDYLSRELVDFVDTCVRNYASGNDAANDAIDPDINLLIDSELNAWVEEVVAAWPNHPQVSNPIDRLAHDEIAQKIPSYIREVFADYFAGNVTNPTVVAIIEEEIELHAPEFIAVFLKTFL